MPFLIEIEHKTRHDERFPASGGHIVKQVNGLGGLAVKILGVEVDVSLEGLLLIRPDAVSQIVSDARRNSDAKQRLSSKRIVKNFVEKWHGVYLSIW